VAIFRDRIDAGRHLAARLLPYVEGHRFVVLGLARGGVAVAEQIAVSLAVDFDVLVLGKVGVPGRRDLTMAAVTGGGLDLVNQDVIDEFEVGPETFRRLAEDARADVLRRELMYRGDREARDLAGQMVVLVDDGLATGMTMRAAVEGVRAQTPARVLVAVPVAPVIACEELRMVADAVIAVHTPQPFYGIGQWYQHFPKATDDEVREALARNWRSSFVRSESSLPA
jgi:putative phosphoribosyl transferase